MQLINRETGILKWKVTTNYICPEEAESGSAVQSITPPFATIGSFQGPIA
jgi:hypothetical protein